ncbi:MAG: 4Fe-4S binding protein, partial [Alphaproteobacteria bacterium]|nr:4Fe-4S binding protein [Alphaproteobacteria bacterium]
MSEWINRFGVKQKIPSWIKWEGTPIISFMIVTIWAQTIGARDHPAATSLIFVSTFIFALIIGYLYGKNKRVWCRHLCPIGLLLGVYSRLGIFQIYPKKKRERLTRYSEKGICPTLIDLPSKDESRHCIACTKCLNPTAKGGMKLLLRRPGEEIEAIAENNPNLSELVFLFLGSGMALGGILWIILPEYQIFRQELGIWFLIQGFDWIGQVGPSWLVSVHPEDREVFIWLDFVAISSFMILTSLVMAIVMSLSTLLSAWLLLTISPTKERVKMLFLKLGYQFMPLCMAGLLLGLGTEMFSILSLLGLSDVAITNIRTTLLVLSAFWSG